MQPQTLLDETRETLLALEAELASESSHALNLRLRDEARVADLRHAEARGRWRPAL